MKILLVEDDWLLAKGTAKLVERLGGHTVEITTEPEYIFQQCEAGAIDLVMMDVNLPGTRWQGQEMSGADLSTLLKTNPRTAHIPIILVTAYAMTAQREMLLQISQADELFTKPITDYDSLMERIEKLTS